MYYNDLTVKELVNLRDGRKVGWAGVYDLVIDPHSGKILSLVVEKRSFWGARGGEDILVPWTAIKRIGTDVIILDYPLADENE